MQGLGGWGLGVRATCRLAWARGALISAVCKQRALSGGPRCVPLGLPDVLYCVVTSLLLAPTPQPYGQQTFDPAPYSEQLRTNQSNQAESTQRNFVGSGHILAFDSQSRS